MTEQQFPLRTLEEIIEATKHSRFLTKFFLPETNEFHGSTFHKTVYPCRIGGTMFTASEKNPFSDDDVVRYLVRRAYYDADGILRIENIAQAPYYESLKIAQTIAHNVAQAPNREEYVALAKAYAERHELELGIDLQ